MTRKTVKYMAALEQAKQLGEGRALVRTGISHEKLYSTLERAGYSWDDKKRTWGKWETPRNAPKTGHVDIRVRASTGDVERAVKLIGDALQAAGFRFTRLSPPDPDDRDGPAVTARVYMSGMLPEE